MYLICQMQTTDKATTKQRTQWQDSKAQHALTIALVLGWVTVFRFDSWRRHFISVCNQPPRLTQPSTLHGKLKSPAKRWWCCAAVKITAGLAESKGSLLLGGWLKSPAGWLPVHRDQLWAQRSVMSMGSLYLYVFITVYLWCIQAYCNLF